MTMRMNPMMDNLQLKKHQKTSKNVNQDKRSANNLISSLIFEMNSNFSILIEVNNIVIKREALATDKKKAV